MDEQELITLTDAARELGISRQRLAILAKEKRLGRQIAGHYWVFTRAEIETHKPLVKSSKGGRPKDDLNPTMKYETPSSVPASGNY